MYYSPATGGFYNRDIHGSAIPADAVEITAEEHAALLDGQAAGRRIVPDADGRPVLVDPPPRPLLEVKAAAVRSIDTQAEAERLKHLTGGSAQALVYQRKAEEAGALTAAVAAGQAPDPAAYPHLAAEVGVTAATLEDVAETVLAMEARWARISAAIEGARLQAKRAVAEAAEAAAVQAVLDAVVWPAPDSPV